MGGGGVLLRMSIQVALLAGKARFSSAAESEEAHLERGWGKRGGVLKCG